MEKELTPVIKAWLDTDKDKRDLMQGATVLLQITKNKILFNNIVRNLSGSADIIEYHLQKAYNIRVQDVTKAKVKELLTEVEKVDKNRNLSGEQATNRSEFQRGKRADHDTLPEAIQQLYVDNALIMHKMRDNHAKLRLINSDNSTCPDSDRYAFAKEILALDKRYRQNWYDYDHYKQGSPVETSQAEQSDLRSVSKRAVKLINLNKTRYAQSRDADLGDRIKEWYSQVLNPSEKLTAELVNLGLINETNG
jgi:hypothetical protein